MSDDPELRRIQVPMTDTMIAELDAMAERERQPDETRPNRARTIRRLIRKGMDAERGAAR